MADYKNLHQKTIFDFCDDPKIIKRMGYHLLPKEMMVNHFLKNPDVNGIAIISLAEITHNKDLKNAASEQFKDEMECNLE